MTGKLYRFGKPFAAGYRAADPDEYALTPLAREVVEAHFKGNPAAEIARKLEMSESNVHSIIQAATLAMRRFGLHPDSEADQRRFIERAAFGLPKKS